MNKYETLGHKLNNIVSHIDGMTIEDEKTWQYLMKYRKYIMNLINKVNNRTIVDSDGGVLGLIRGISDYDEICADDQLWKMVVDADRYYKYDCYTFN